MSADPSGFSAADVELAPAGGFMGTMLLGGLGLGSVGFQAAPVSPLGAAGGLGGGVGNVASTLASNPFGGSGPSALSVAAPSGAPNASPVKPGGTNAVGQPSPPAPLTLPEGRSLCETGECFAQDAGTPSSGAEGASNSGNSRAHNSGRGEEVAADFVSNYVPGGPIVKGLAKVKWIKWLANLRAARAMKAINLPSWSKITVDNVHIFERHMHGAKYSAGRTVFPSTMNEKGIMRAIREAYQSSSKVGVQGTDRVLLQGQGRGLTIEIWFNKATNTIETAYPVTP